MKSLVAIVVVIVLSGCVSDESFPKRYGNQLSYKCDIDPYNYECLNPPPVFKN